MCMPEVKRVNLIKDIILERDLVYFDLLSSPNDPLGCVSLKLHVYILRIVNWGFPAKVVIYNYVLRWTTTLPTCLVATVSLPTKFSSISSYLHI